MITILINKLTVFLESLEAKIMNEKVLLKSKHKDLIEDFIQRIKKNLDSIKNSYKTLVMYSQGKNYFGFDYMNEKSSKSKSMISEFVKPMQRSYSKEIYVNKGFQNKEIVEEVTPFNGGSPNKLSVSKSSLSKGSLYRKDKKKRVTDYYSDWRTPWGSEENFILYFIFFYLSLLVDKAKGVESKRKEEGKLLYPQTNLRWFAKTANTLFITLIVAVIYYYLFW